MRNALLSTQLTPELVSKLRTARIKIAQETAISPAVVADRAVARRLFGDFPYGRPPQGSAEDLARVERGDLMLARERFLNSNNATLAISGGVDRTRALRALRQLLGAWRKSEQIIPTTFRQPQPPDIRTLIVSGPSDQTAEIRVAVRGVSRSDPDAPAATVLSIIAKHKLEEMAPVLNKKPLSVRSDSYTLPGMFVLGAAVNNQSVVDTMAAARKVLEELTKSPVTGAELERAKGEINSEVTAAIAKPEGMIDKWLDLDTYHTPPIQDQTAALSALTVADIQRVANRLFHETLLASVVVGEPQQLKPLLQGRLQFEVMGEIVPPTPSPKPAMKQGGNIKPR
jgi:zinc protease